MTRNKCLLSVLLNVLPPFLRKCTLLIGTCYLPVQSQLTTSHWVPARFLPNQRVVAKKVQGLKSKRGQPSPGTQISCSENWPGGGESKVQLRRVFSVAKIVQNINNIVFRCFNIFWIKTLNRKYIFDKEVIKSWRKLSTDLVRNEDPSEDSNARQREHWTHPWQLIILGLIMKPTV